MVHKLDNPERIAELAPKNTLHKIGLSDGMTFCDIGAGTGVFTVPAAEYAEVYAVEIAEDRRKLLRERTGDNVRVVDGIHDVPDGVCDLALLCAVLHELDDVPDMERQIGRILKVGGVLAVLEFHKDETKSGPPMEMRMTEEEVAAAFASGFSQIERFDLGESYYCLIFKKN